MDDRHRGRQDDPAMPPNYRYLQGMHTQASSQQQQHQPHQQQQQQPQQHQQHQQQQQQQQQLQQQQLQQQQHQQQRRAWSRGSMDRFRPAPLNTSTSAMASRDMGAAAGYSDQYYQGSAASSYATSSLPQGTMGYQATSAAYGQHDGRQTQNYPATTYHPTTAMMYNVPQPASTQNAPVYDTSQQFSSRQPAGMPLMTPDVAGHYYQAGPTSASGAASAMQPQTAHASASPAVYQQPSSLQSYSTNIASMSGMAGPTTSGTPDVSMEEQASPTEEDPMQSFEHYETTLREGFRDIREGNLVAASESLISASTLLCEGVSRFGLASDDARVRPNRNGIWAEFNHAWLALLQRQKDLIEGGQQSERSQSVLTLESLKGLGDKLVELSDKLERHGLVDYECGLWEEQIVDILDDCVEQYEPLGADDSGIAPSSSSPQ